MRDRGDRLAQRLPGRGLDLLLVTELLNVRWLTGFTGTNGACVCGPETRLLLTDFRYTERAAAEVEGWDVVTVTDRWQAGLADRLAGRVGFEDDRMTVRTREKLGEAISDDVELVAAGGTVEELRRVKDSAEIEAIAAAAQLADDAYRWALERGLGGRSERDVAQATEGRIRELGGQPSFPSIVAAGPNGAQPHAEPGERQIGAGELVVFDMGAQLDGYCSDCTRTFAVGDPGGRAREIYELVRAAQANALDTVADGAEAKVVDAAGRDVIAAAGHGERFGHGLGHGVGLEVHEAPHLSTRSEETLAANEVVTIEPGVYLPGEFGVRIEDLVVVEKSGNRNLSGLPKELQTVD